MILNLILILVPIFLLVYCLNYALKKRAGLDRESCLIAQERSRKEDWANDRVGKVRVMRAGDLLVFARKTYSGRVDDEENELKRFKMKKAGCTTEVKIYLEAHPLWVCVLFVVWLIAFASNSILMFRN